MRRKPPARAEQDADVLLMETGRILVDAMTLRPDTDIARRGTPVPIERLPDQPQSRRD
ncbi:MAG: hypothetical protein CM15mP84_08110 [Cellvibrionales bacterium]|nr:MAG: hypothetical protein CM15mP84_08110 [Cellvibrionales bacterium]